MSHSVTFNFFMLLFDLFFDFFCHFLLLSSYYVGVGDGFLVPTVLRGPLRVRALVLVL